MNKFINVKIFIALISGFLLVGVGAYNFATGNVKFARLLFAWGVISMGVGIVWVLASKRHNQTSKKLN